MVTARHLLATAIMVGDIGIIQSHKLTALLRIRLFIVRYVHQNLCDFAKTVFCDKNSSFVFVLWPTIALLDTFRYCSILAFSRERLSTSVLANLAIVTVKSEMSIVHVATSFLK